MRALPHDYPSYRLVFYYYGIWLKNSDKGESILDYCLAKLMDIYRYDTRENPLPSMLIIDSKSIQNADTAEEKVYDVGKKKSGVKLHIAVDVLGFPYAACVTTANVTDRDGAVQMFKTSGFCPTTFEKAFVDEGYSGDKFAEAIFNLTGANVEVAKRSDLHKFAVIPKGWIVERSFAWVDKCRIPWKNC